MEDIFTKYKYFTFFQKLIPQPGDSEPNKKGADLNLLLSIMNDLEFFLIPPHQNSSLPWWSSAIHTLPCFPRSCSQTHAYLYLQGYGGR